MAASTFLPRHVKNLGGSASRNAYDHSLSSNPKVARIFTWNGTAQTPGATFNLATQGCNDATAKLLWSLGFLDF